MPLAGAFSAGLAAIAVLAVVAFLPPAAGCVAVGPAAGGLPMPGALTGQPSGRRGARQGGQAIARLATPPATGGVHRAFTLRAPAASSGRELTSPQDGGWRVEVRVAGAEPPGADFAPASEAEAGAIGPVLDRTAAGLALPTKEEKAAAMARGWAT